MSFWCLQIFQKTNYWKSRAVVLVSSTPKHFQTVYEGEIWCLCTVTFGQKSSKLNSRPVYCSNFMVMCNLLIAIGDHQAHGHNIENLFCVAKEFFHECEHITQDTNQFLSDRFEAMCFKSFSQFQQIQFLVFIKLKTWKSISDVGSNVLCLSLVNILQIT